VRRIRNFFIAGLIVFIPLAFTVVFLRFMFKLVDGILREPVEMLIGYHIPGLGVVASLILILLIGGLATNLIGKRLIALGESIIVRTPFAGAVYVTVKQIVDAFIHSERTPFQHVCLIEYPRKGMWSIAFVTGETPASMTGGRAEDLINVFIPTTPNPTSGFLILVPREDVIYLDVPVEDGLKMVVSGGILTPEQKKTVMEGSPGE